MNLSNETIHEYINMFTQIEPNLVLTLNTYPGCLVSDQRMLSHLEHMDAKVARRILGRRWDSKPNHLRFQGVFVLEHGTSRTNPHWHGLLRVPEEDLLQTRFLIKNSWGLDKWDVWTDLYPQSIERLSRYYLKGVTEGTTDKIVFTNMLRN